MKTERLDAWTSEGRRVAAWRSAPEDFAPDAPIVVMSPGFARRMRDVGSIALCLVGNGAIVYRFDALDHIGLSDGDIRNFTLTGMRQSMIAAIELARATENRRGVRLVAMSLANLAAYRVAAEDKDIERIMALSGVVNGRRTIKEVIGHDYPAVTREELPAIVPVMGHDVDPRPLWTDSHETDCLSYERTIADLKAISASVANCVAEGDPWVDVDECTTAYTDGDGGERMVIKLPYSGHDLGRNPIAVMTILERMASLAIGNGPMHDADPQAVVMPTFEAVLEARIAERHQDFSEQRAAKTEGSPAV